MTHLTNFVPVDISVRRIQVMGDDPTAATIADYQRAELRRIDVPPSAIAKVAPVSRAHRAP